MFAEATRTIGVALFSPSKNRNDGLEKGGAERAMQANIPKPIYVFVFECKMCKQNICSQFRAKDPETTVQLACVNSMCGWQGLRSWTEVKRIFMQDANLTIRS